MTTLDLDRLKQRWSAQSRDIDAQLELDVDAVRRRLTAQTATALARQRNRRLRALCIGGGVFAAFVAFMAAHVADLPYLLFALPFALVALAQGIVDWREWQTLRRLDFGSTLTQLRAEYDVLRARRLQMALVIAQLSVLLWLPLVFIVVKTVSGVDLLDRLPFSVTAVNVGLGVVLVPLIAGILRGIAQLRPDSAALRRFADEAAGTDWLRTRDHLDRQLDFERELADDDGRAAVRRHAAAAFAPALEQARIAARRRVDLGIALITAALLLSGTFNALHGGDAAALVPGVFQHLIAVGWLIGAILQFDALARPRDDAPGTWRARLQRAIRLRTVLLQSYVVASPLIALALLQTLGLAAAGIDLWQTLGMAVWLGLGLVALFAMALLHRRWRRERGAFAARFVDALSLGSLSRAQRAIEIAAATADEDDRRDAA
jgi:hypothetical protein